MWNEAKKKDISYKRLICAALTENTVPEIETGDFDGRGLISAGALLKAHVRLSAFVLLRLFSFPESPFPFGRKTRALGATIL